MADYQDGLLLESGGSVYFIPKDDLTQYRIPEERAGKIVEAMDEQLGSEVSGFADFSAVEKFRPDVKPLRAFEGPLGIKVPTPGSNEDTVIIR